jgi:periplasmic protein TonB
MSENNLFSGGWMNEVADVRNDIVFQNRNQSYGAYQIRRGYNRTVFVALLISSIAFVFFTSLPAILEMISKAEEEEVKTNTEVVVDLEAPPPVDETEPPPPPPPPPPVMETIKFTPPVVVDEPLPEDEAPPVQEEIKAQVADVTQQGSGDDIIIVEEGTGEKVVEEEPDKVFLSVEEMPSFPGGEEALLKYLAKNTQYPAMEKDANIQGVVYVSFVVNKEGKITNVEIKRSVKGGPGFDKEAIRVISSLPKWSPGKQNGRPVSVAYTLPVRFVLR